MSSLRWMKQQSYWLKSHEYQLIPIFNIAKFNNGGRKIANLDKPE